MTNTCRPTAAAEKHKRYVGNAGSSFHLPVVVSNRPKLVSRIVQTKENICGPIATETDGWHGWTNDGSCFYSLLLTRYAPVNTNSKNRHRPPMTWSVPSTTTSPHRCRCGAGARARECHSRSSTVLLPFSISYTSILPETDPDFFSAIMRCSSTATNSQWPHFMVGTGRSVHVCFLTDCIDQGIN